MRPGALKACCRHWAHRIPIVPVAAFVALLIVPSAGTQTANNVRFPRYDDKPVRIHVVTDLDASLVPVLRDAAKGWEQSGDLRFNVKVGRCEGAELRESGRGVPPQRAGMPWRAVQDRSHASDGVLLPRSATPGTAVPKESPGLRGLGVSALSIERNKTGAAVWVFVGPVSGSGRASNTVCVSPDDGTICGQAAGCFLPTGTNGLLTAGRIWLNTNYLYAGLDWQKHILCHELGHAIGLGHTEDGPQPARPSCMANSPELYSSAPSVDDLAFVHALYAVKDKR